MSSDSPIRVVVRAIELLQALNRQPVSTLDELHRQTGIPKPSISRLLGTLESKGLVEHAPQYGSYHLTAEVATLSNGYHSEPMILEAAAPVADAFTQDQKWPVAIAVYDGDAMVVRYSTIPKSPLSFLHSSINMRLSLVSRALGRAYLAFCHPDEQAIILELLAHSEREEDAAARDPKLPAMLADIRARGYAERDPAVRPVSSTLAVPLFHRHRVIASMGVTWFSSALTAKSAIERYLPLLQEAAADITLRLGHLSDAVDAVPAARSARPSRRRLGEPRAFRSEG